MKFKTNFLISTSFILSIFLITCSDIKWEGSFSWQSLGTNSYQSVSINNESDFTLKVEISDISETASSQQFVTVNLSGCSPMDPCKN